MCGIAGLLCFDAERADPAQVVAMRDAIAHRGPDGAGLWCEGSVGLGHRRLAILDPRPRSDQPMLSADERYVLVYNGEIYNFRTLADRLRRAGHVFQTSSDTEVLLAAIGIWGLDETVRQLDGMAAFALWDRTERRLHLVRDRYGIKPLYLWRGARHLAFGSEIKAFMAHSEFTVAVNRDALREYFTFQNLFRDHTLFTGVTHLPPASILTVEADGTEHCRRYWNYDFSSPVPMEREEAVEELAGLMGAAVERQLVSDVPVGAYLSGGMDSGSIVAFAARHVARLQTFTAGFDMSRVSGMELNFDERRAAELMACEFGTEHYEQVINAGDLRWSLPRVVWHLEDLRLGMSYPNFYIARLASKFVKVCLSGAGGDELFGGYPWRYYRAFRALNRQDYLSSYYEFWQRLTTSETRARLFRTPGSDQQEMRSIFAAVYDDAPNLDLASPEDQIAASLYFEGRTFLSGLLVVGDRLSMAHGLEERFPFLDNALVDFAMQVPTRYKLSDLDQMLEIDEDAVRKKLLAEASHSSGKSCLRDAMSRVLPTAVMERPKQGFSSPEASWYRGENADYLRTMLMDGDLACAEYLDPDVIRETVTEHMSEARNNRLLIWSFLSFEQWCRTFLGGEVPQ